VNFALFSRHAQAVCLVLFEDDREEPLVEIPLDPSGNKTGDVWHILVHGLPTDIRYGYRVDGPFAPRTGHRFNPRAILLDPYAPAISDGYCWGKREPGETRRGRVVFDDFDWEGDVPLCPPLAQTVIYELHVRGYTRHPSAGVKNPGTFLGLIEKIPYLKSL